MANEISTRQQGDVTIVDIQTEQVTGLTNVDSLREQMSAFVTEEKPSKLLINFANVKFITSDGIGIFLSVRKVLKEHGGEIKLFGMQSVVLTAFKILNLVGTVFEVHDTEAAGADSF